MIVVRLGLTACLGLVAAAAGCHSADSRDEGVVPAALEVAAARESRPERRRDEQRPARDPQVVPAGFPSEVSTEQRINTHIDLARALDAQDRGEEAIAEYQRAIEALADSPRFRGSPNERARLHRRIGGSFDRLGKFDEARNHYREAQRLAPRDGDVWNDTGYSEYLQGRFTEAEQAFRKALSLDPSNPRILTNLGLTLGASGRSDAALEVLTKAGGPAAAHANLAYVLAARGRLDAARAHYHAALTIDPEMTAAREGLRQIDRRIAQTARTSISTAGRGREFANQP